MKRDAKEFLEIFNNDKWDEFQYVIPPEYLNTNHIFLEDDDYFIDRCGRFLVVCKKTYLFYLDDNDKWILVEDFTKEDGGEKE